MIVVDASVWVAAGLPTDPFHQQSRSFLRRVSDQGVKQTAPALLIAEIACAVARRTRDPERGETLAMGILHDRTLSLEEMSTERLVGAVRIGARLRLRGADALYAELAASRGLPLVSWDSELIARAGAITPSDWMAQHA